MANKDKEDLPSGWGNDDLTGFIDLGRQNQLATFVKLKGSFARLRDIDGLFLKLNRNLNETEHWFSALFCFKSHSSFRVASQLSMSGQLSETYLAIRACLESALYSFKFFSEPSCAPIWAKRGESPEARKAVKKAFKIGEILDAFEKAHSEVGSIVRDLYENSIDFGAHPNSHDLFSNLNINEAGDETTFKVAYITGDSVQKRLALKNVARTGVAALYIFETIFTTRFKLLGLDAALKKVRAGL